MALTSRPDPTSEQADKIHRHIWHRASGDCICSSCGRIYYKHPYFQEPYEWITLLCDGSMVKL